MVFFGWLGSFTGDFLGDGGSLLSAGVFDFLIRMRFHEINKMPDNRKP